MDLIYWINLCYLFFIIIKNGYQRVLVNILINTQGLIAGITETMVN